MNESVREGFGKALVEAGKENKDVVVLDADLATSTRVCYFAQEFPERFFQIGVAEQNMTSVAAGLALMGKTPFTSTFAVFASRRAADQVAMSAAYPGLNVKVVGAYPGLVSGNNGASHQAVEDIAIMRSIPGMTVIEPADGMEAGQVVKEVIKYKGPVYLRITRDEWPKISPDNYQFKIGKAVIIEKGKDITLIGSGMMVSQCVKASNILKEQGISATVINLSTIKPIDKETIIKSAQETRAVVTAENHNIQAGMGSAVAEVLAENCPVVMKRIGLKDTYGECGQDDELLKKYEMSPAHIVQAAREVIKKK